MNKYKFPLNYNYSNRFLGIIEYKTLVPLLCYGAMLIFVISLFKLDLFISAGIFTFLFFPFVLLLSLGFSREPFFPFLISLIKFRKNSKIYLYKKGIAKMLKKRYDLSKEELV